MDRRFFVVDGEDLLKHLAVYLEEHNAQDAVRKAFFEEWGSGEYVSGHRSAILALKDPRTFDEPKPLPKGWRMCRSKRFSGYVEPSGGAKWAILNALNFPVEQHTCAEVMKRIVAQSEENYNRVVRNGGWDTNRGLVSWLAWVDDQSYMFEIGVAYFRHADLWVMVIPDPELKFESVDGLREIRRWEYEKLLDDYEQWRKERDKNETAAE